MTDTRETGGMIRLSAALAALVDELLPGNDDWPSGSTVGVQHAIVERLAGREGDSGLEHLAHLLDGIGAPFDGWMRKRGLLPSAVWKAASLPGSTGCATLPFMPITRIRPLSP